MSGNQAPPKPPSQPPPSQKRPSQKPTEQAEKAARDRDPHGTGPASHSTEDEPAAQPNSDRHRSETAVKK